MAWKAENKIYLEEAENCLGFILFLACRIFLVEILGGAGNYLVYTARKKTLSFYLSEEKYLYLININKIFIS